MSRPVIYTPPDPALVHTFAREVCLCLARQGDPGYARSEVIQGLADYLNFTAALMARLINEGHDEFIGGA